MKHKFCIILLIISNLFYSCSNDNTSKIEDKGFAVSSTNSETDENQDNGLKTDTLFETRPRNVLFTKHSEHRITPIYKVNYDKKGRPFSGSNNFYFNYQETEEAEGNNWNNNFMPGFEGVYGYNFVNVSHYNNQTQMQNNLFDKPVLIKSLYYPAFSKDTLNFKPVSRNYYMISVYDEDTNKDGFINMTDLRRFYYFDINGENKKEFVPKNYSVMSSEYDFVNDYMYVFAKFDQNKNGQIENGEEMHIFWIDLANPENTGKQY